MTRKNSATLDAPKAKSPKKAKRAPKAIKVSGIELAIRKNLGHDPVMYGDDPPKREMRKVRLGTIKVDRSYQREFRRAHAEKIAANFDIQKMGIPLLNDRNGRLFCVDGQHSIHAIEIINSVYPGFLTSIWCEVVAEAGPKQEADLFVGRNYRSKMPPTSTFKAEHRSGNPTCIKVANILHSRGLSVKGMRIRNTLPITCIVPVCWAHRMGVLEDSIDVIKATYGLIEQAFQVTVFHPVAALIVKNRGHVDFDLLVRTLSRFTPAGLLTKCGTPDGRGRTVNIANFIVNAYNRAAKKSEKIETVGGSDIS
jgi:hypothetical protein